MQKTKNQEFKSESLDDKAPEPMVDTATDGSEPVDESFQDAPSSAKMAESEREKKEDWQDKYIRLSAEFDNYRKRTAREKMDLMANAGADVLKSMLSTADDFDRALTHIASQADRAGVELIYAKFLSTLKERGVEPMDLVGKPFDVDYAEAIAKFPATDVFTSGVVMEVAQKGYMIKDKVLRFAQVVVAE